jgi:hypothetical protein
MSTAPQPNWAGTPQPSNSSWVPAMLVGALIFAVGCGSGLVTGWFAGVANNLGGAFDGMLGPADLMVEAEYPGTVTVGQPFELVIRVTDTRGEAREVSDIDFYGSLCDDFSFGAITPAPGGFDSSSSEYREHNFNRTLAAYGTEEFRFTLTPTAAGDYSGTEITVYDANYNSEMTYLSIIAE